MRIILSNHTFIHIRNKVASSTDAVDVPRYETIDTKILPSPSRMGSTGFAMEVVPTAGIGSHSCPLYTLGPNMTLAQYRCNIAVVHFSNELECLICACIHDTVHECKSVVRCAFNDFSFSHVKRMMYDVASKIRVFTGAVS